MKCDDPYWTGCKKPAAFKRNRNDDFSPDNPKYLCEECYMLMMNDESFKAEEWVKMVY